MKSILCVLLLTICVIWIEAKRERYDGYTVYRITPKNEAQMKLIDELERHEVRKIYYTKEKLLDSVTQN